MSKALRKVFVGGNWKSNGDLKFLKSHFDSVLKPLKFDANKVDVIIAPVSIHLQEAKRLLKEANSNVQLSSQNVSAYNEGAYTGEITANQLKDLEVLYTLVGHSERRTIFNEDDKQVSLKTKLAQEKGLNVIACIGELLKERENNETMKVCLKQLDAISSSVKDWSKVVIAYEPVWAIGTGKTASKEQAQEVHLNLRNHLQKQQGKEVADKVRIIYGGSVTEGNASELIQMNDIDGFLVGGASLKPGFVQIVESYKNKKL